MSSFILALGTFIELIYFGQCQHLTDDSLGLLNVDHLAPFQVNLHTRTRRDTKIVSDKKPKDQQEIKGSYTKILGPCCDVQMSNSLRNDEYKNLCYNKTLGTLTFTNHGRSTSVDVEKQNKLVQNQVSCYLNCLALKYNLVKTDGSIILEGVIKRINDIYNGSWVPNVSRNIATTCYKATEQACINYLKTATADRCNPTFRMHNWCLHREIQMNCPKDQIKNEVRCNDLKNWKFDYNRYS
ncbi:hypothetical protein PPYR_09203 [Photinus pyralis]|uniref:Uncharacterized protein n=1 Tax=Photinus pyralis TaxID=7054 RepID=A0A5N4ALJ8_PHOPY|nr:uncharacterized protein LOC116172506 [Photinus pyralis]KAB0798210.1 hypothetical protein PPYR_09203 [Photinus pyralis]